MIIGITEQDIITRMGGGDYYKRTTRHMINKPVSIDAFVNKGGHAVIENKLYDKISNITGVEIITKEEFWVPYDSVKKVISAFDEVAGDFFSMK